MTRPKKNYQLCVRLGDADAAKLDQEAKRLDLPAAEIARKSLRLGLSLLADRAVIPTTSDVA